MNQTIFNPSTGQTATAPAGTAIPSGWQVMTPTTNAPQTNSSSGNGVPVNTSNLIASIRTQIASGSITGQQAMGVLQSQLAAAQTQSSGKPSAFNPADYAAQLYAPLTINANGKISTLNSDGTTSSNATTVNQSTQNNTGVSSNTTYQNNYAGADPNVTLTPAQAASNAAIVASNGQSLSGSSTSPAGTLSNAGSGSSLPSTGNSNLDAIQGQFANIISGSLAAGFTVNPGLNITPDVLNQFISEAHSQLDPKYQQTLEQEMTGITAYLSNAATTYNNTQASTIQDYQANLAGERDTMGNNGVAFGGARNLNEQNLANSANYALSTNAANTAYATSNQLNAAGAALGPGIPGLTGPSSIANPFGQPLTASGISIPNLTGYSVGTSGARGNSSTGAALNFNYNPSMYAYGSIPGDYGSDFLNQLNQTASTYQNNAANTSASRTLPGVTSPLTT